MIPKAHYRINSLQRRKASFHACGFVIYLDPALASAACNLKMSAEQQRKYIERIRELVGYEYTQVMFHEDTAFIRSLSVEGNCACLGTDGSAFSQLIAPGGFDEVRYVEFHTHNVDTRQQAFDLLAAFNYWVEVVEAMTT